MGQAVVVLPPAAPAVPADTTRNGLIRYARAINDALNGNINATLQLTLVANDITSTFTDTRLGPWSFVWLMPLTAHAADLLPTIWVDPTKGSAVIHHARSSYTDLIYLAAILGS